MQHQIEPLLIGSVVLVVAYAMFIEYLKVQKKDQMNRDNKGGD